MNVEFSTTLGTFPNESSTYSTSTPDEGGSVTVSLIAGTTEGTARITVQSNGITQTYDVEFTVQVVGSVTVTPGSPQLLADGVSQTEISATVKDTSNHNMPDGTTVYFSTDLGTLSTSSATITNGQATVTLTSSTLVGTATITATAASVSSDTQVTFIPGDIGAISLTAIPNNLTADGQSISTVVATVTDAQGNLIADGNSINFSVITGTGTLSISGAATNVQTVNATTVNGLATVTYTASFTALTETVRAQATNGTTATVDIVLINQTVGSVTVSAGSSEIVANGTSTTTISATIKDLSGINVRDGIIVSFTSTAGTLLSSTAATVNGVATVTLRSSTNLGFTEVRATAGGVNGTVTVNFVPGAPFRITVLTIPATVSVNGTSSIDVIVYDQYDNPVADGETLTFSAQAGTLDPLMVTTSGGMASVTYTAPSFVPAIGYDNITVQATNGQTGTAIITVTEPEVTGITLTANPVGLPADGSSQSTITATVTVAGGGNAPDGTGVDFSIVSGGGSITPSATTTNGTASAVLTSGTVTETVTVRAEAEGVSGTIAVEYTATPASLSLGLSQATVQSDNSDSSTITATVLDANFAVVEGITVTFTSDGGQLSAASGETDANGEATVEFSSGTTDRTNRVVTITATVPGLPDSQIPVQVTGTTLSLTTDTTNLEIGGNNQATLTITARDAGSVPIFNGDITITSSPLGIVQINPTTGTTNVSGQLQVTVTAQSTGDTTVTATGLGAAGTQNYSVGAVGAVFTITSPTEDPYSARTLAVVDYANTGPLANVFSFNDNDPAQDTITRSAGSFTAEGFVTGDEIMVTGSLSNDGTYTIDTVAAATLTLVLTDSLTTEAADPGNTVTISNGVIVRVTAPTQASVQFATTLGVWNGGTNAIITEPVVGGVVEAVLTSNEAGTANIQVSDAGDPLTSDSTVVIFSAPTSEASKISLQASATVVAPSTGGVSNSVTLQATVKNASDQVVGDAAVAFSIENPTGGGEFISPPVSNTDSFGVAEATFTSGSLGSDAQGVTVAAEVVINTPATTGAVTNITFNDADPDTITRAAGDFTADGFTAGDQIRVTGSASNDGYYTISNVAILTITLVSDDELANEAAGASVTITTVIRDSIQIVIGGTGGSVVIGQSTTIESVNSDTAYSLPMSVLVSDSNGNPVTGAVVTLNLWPKQYATGCWVLFGELWVPGDCVDPNLPYWFYDNEDDTYGNQDARYRNLVLDPGEDGFFDPLDPPWDPLPTVSTGAPAQPDGQLTPPLSAAGSVPATVLTDENGVGTFNLVYLKSSAVWISVEIKASTIVSGTENQGTEVFTLPWMEADGGNLPHSAYNQ